MLHPALIAGEAANSADRNTLSRAVLAHVRCGELADFVWSPLLQRHMCSCSRSHGNERDVTHACSIPRYTKSD